MAQPPESGPLDPADPSAVAAPAGAGPTASEAEAPDLRPALLGLSVEELRETLGDLLDRPFRAGQIHRAIHRRSVESFAAMTDLSADLRDRLEASYRIGWPEMIERHDSADGTGKYLLRLDDGATIEVVDIPETRRRTLCVSSQAGCALGCTFCVTGFWGAGRDLTPGEIVAQVLTVCRDRELAASSLNLVFMGMGEPLLNLEGLKRALAILTEDIAWRRITVSTAGVVPGIEAMARWPKRPNLAISLHAPDDARRDRVMPINRTYPLERLMESLRRYPMDKGRKITFEYILIRDFNDAPADADATVRLLHGLPAKVNLIPINPDPVLGEHMVPPDDAVVRRFASRLKSRGMVATVRRRRGDEVSAACGQLRAFGRSPSGAIARAQARAEKQGAES